MADNKILFGLKNAHYSKITVDGNGIITYATPKKLEGSTELSLEPRGDMVEFYADDILYYSASNNQGYDGTLTLANISEEFMTEILGEIKDSTDSVMTEKADATSSYFALMFEFAGDVKAIRHVLYYCSASRPTVGSSTKTDSVEPNTNELTFVASARPSDLSVKTKTTTTTPDNIYNNWYSAVYNKATTPLAVTTTPIDGVVGTLVTSDFIWTFDKSLVATDINSNNFFVISAATGTEVAGALTLDATKKIVTFNPTSNLTATTAYIATVTTGVKASDGSILVGKNIVNFTTV
jgi:phi13 family phage major tail protein